MASSDTPAFICIYVDIRPGIIKRNSPMTNIYHSYVINTGLYFITRSAIKNPTPALKFIVDCVYVQFLRLPYNIILTSIDISII